jgi:hypothetical protein
VAAAIATALAAGDEERVGDRVLDAVWTADARASRAIFLVALEAARRFSRADAQRFFRAFFSLPADHWRGFLDATLSSQQLLAILRALFAHVDGRTRLALARGLFAPASLELLKSRLGGVS